MEWILSAASQIVEIDMLVLIWRWNNYSLLSKILKLKATLRA